MSGNKQDSLDQFTDRELMISTRRILEIVRKEARSSMDRAKSNSREINDLILAIDRINTHYASKIASLRLELEDLKINSVPWYRKLWNNVIRRDKKSTS